MIISIPIVLGLITCLAPPQAQCQTVEELQDKLSDMEQRLNRMGNAMNNLAKQTMMQQFTGEENARSNGDSGVKQVRANNFGPQNYYGNSHINGHSYISIHDHSNYARTVGMGEISVVLNGVDFRTRHNDYKLYMPSTSSTEYHAKEPVPFPEVPTDVTDLDDIDDQIKEMREWFKAFKTQDHSVRDYRKYFKPVLCYLEGTWTQDKKLDEPFESDRHHLEASSWFELMENVRYTAYTGTKNRLENFAFLPTAIMNVNQTSGLPRYAQWNYRIMCHPIQQDLPTKYLKQMDDLAYSYPRGKDADNVFWTRAARFKLYEFDNPKYTKNSLIDDIMYQIPGKDNIVSNLTENSFGESMFKIDEDTVLNAGYYHRLFRFSKPGAMGLTSVSRGYNDENCWVAMTSQERVSPMELEVCKKKNQWDRVSKRTVSATAATINKNTMICKTFENRYSFAIPLEIIYLTPLLTWNPWNLAMHEKGGIATADGRTGNANKPLDGTDGSHHYLTPVQFFQGSTDMSDPADTVKSSIHVLDKDGVARTTAASGTKIILQDIEGVGKVRLRYPIAPVHGEGSSVWKELNALRDYLFKLEKEGISSGGGGGGGDDGDDESDSDDNLPDIIDFEMSPTTIPVDHFHTFSISKQDYLDLKNLKMELRLTTDEAAGHVHKLSIRYHDKRGFEYVKCDNKKTCGDRHKRPVIMIRNG